MIGVTIVYDGWSETETKVLHGVREEHTLENTPIVRRNCSGHLVSRARRGGTKIRVTLSKSGERTWIPYDLEIGSVVRLHSSLWYALPAPRLHGSSQSVYADLSRPALPSGLSRPRPAARRLDGARVPGAIFLSAGNREVFFAAGDVGLYRPVLVTRVVRFDTGGSATGLDQSWSLELLEI